MNPTPHETMRRMCGRRQPREAALFQEAEYSTLEVCELTGATYREVDYWVRRGCVTPPLGSPGTGYARRFSEENVRRVRLIKQLRTLGVPLISAAFIAAENTDDVAALVIAGDEVVPVRDLGDLGEALTKVGGVAVVAVR